MSLQRVPGLDGLRLLLDVDELGSLGRAAARHGISQPAATARIQAMEGLVGVPLVHRSTRGSTLTEDGRLVAGWARRILDAAADFEVGAAALRADADHRLRVAASMTVAEHLLPRWLARFARAMPDTAVRLQPANSARVQEAVLEGSADLGFVEGPGMPTGLDSRVVARDRLVLVVPPDHPWTRRPDRTVDGVDVATTRLIHRETDSGTRSATESALRRAGHGVRSPAAPSRRRPARELPPPLLELGSTRAILNAVAAGAGPALLSRLAVADDVSAGRVVEVAVTGLETRRRLRAVWPHGQRPTAPARELLRIAAAPDQSLVDPSAR